MCVCVSSARTQEEGLRRVQELLAEVSSLEESKKCEREAHDKLKQQYSALVKQFEEEKVMCLSLLFFHFSHSLTFSNCFYTGHGEPGTYPGNTGQKAGIHPG